MERTESVAAQRHRAMRWLAASLVAFAATAALAQSRGFSETVVRAPVMEGRRAVLIELTVLRPDGAGPFPLVVLSHGSPRSAEERRREGRQRLIAQSEPFLAMGFAVLVPTRRG